ncbi:hypothetical protein N9D09_01175, partial [bacterium]|nr:hypothetical protein [bacterium]
MISNGAIYGFGSAIQSLSMFLVIPIITSHSSIEEFGAYGILIGLSSVLNAIFYFGIASALPRFYFEKSEKEYRDSVILSGLILVFIGAIVQIFCIYILWSLELIQSIGSNSLTRETILYFGLNNSLLIINTY